jgi:hypothetical protein
MLYQIGLIKLNKEFLERKNNYLSLTSENVSRKYKDSNIQDVQMQQPYWSSFAGRRMPVTGMGTGVFLVLLGENCNKDAATATCLLQADTFGNLNIHTTSVICEVLVGTLSTVPGTLAARTPTCHGDKKHDSICDI